MSIKLYNCNCEFEKSGTGTDNVCGYILVKECEECKIKRELQTIITEKENRKQEIISELNQLDLKIIRPLADGELEKVEKIKDKKVLLREELKTL